MYILHEPVITESTAHMHFVMLLLLYNLYTYTTDNLYTLPYSDIYFFNFQVLEQGSGSCVHYAGDSCSCWTGNNEEWIQRMRRYNTGRMIFTSVNKI